MDLMATAVMSEDITPEKYLKLSESDKYNIESSSIVPPKLGGNDLGKIRINYKSPRYQVNFNEE